MPRSRKATLARGAMLYVTAGALMAVTAAAAPGPSLTAAVNSPDTHAKSGTPRATAKEKKTTKTPCATPATTGAVSSGSQAAGKAAAHGAAWTGVVERVIATLNADGSVARTPNLIIRASAAGNGPVTVRVPVAGSITNRRNKGRGTPVVNGQAQISLDPHGTADQQVNSSFTRPLPVTVAVTYRLNGKTVSNSQVKGKSGTVQVSYKLANVSSRPISACFEGFNGAHQHQTLSTPIPILADLSFTVPGQATSFTAPGASLSPNSKGVSVGWTASLFKPLGPLTQTFTFTMKTSQASIPGATLLLATVNPYTLTGKAPATSAAVLGTAEAAVAKGVSSVRSTLGSVQQGVSRLQASTSSSADPAASDPPAATAVNAELATLGKFIAAVGAKLGTLGTSVGKLASRSTRFSTGTSHVAALANTISTVATGIATRVNAVEAQLPVAIQNAQLEIQQLNQLGSDLSAFPPAVQHTPVFRKLAADLIAAKVIAGKISNAVTAAHRLAQAIASRVQKLQSDISSLAAEAAALKAAAAALAALAQRTLQTRLGALQQRFAALQNEFAAAASDIKTRVAHAEAIASRARSRLAAAVTAAKQDLAHALLQGEQAVQAALNQAQAQAAQAAQQAQSSLAKANAQYARLLCLDEQAVLNEMPAGSAPGVTMQNGVYLYRITGKSGPSKKKSAATSRRTKRQNARKSRRTKRQNARKSRRNKRH